MKRSATLDTWLQPKSKSQTVEVAKSVTATALQNGCDRVEVEVTPEKVKVVATKPVAAPKPKLFTKSVAARTGTPTPLIIGKFADYIDVAMEGVGDAAFLYAQHGTPLAGKSSALRGTIAEAVVKRIYATERGFEIVDAEAGTCVNGTARGECRERYDFGIRGVDEDGSWATFRIEVKNSRMSYVPSMERWQLIFANVKRTEHDELCLVFEGLDGVRVYIWRGQNASTRGKHTKAMGENIKVSASRSQPDATSSHAQLVEEMAERNELIKFVAYTDPAYADLWATTTRTATTYDAVPMGTLSGSARGTMVENVVRSVMVRLGHTVEDAPTSSCVNGAARGKNTTTCDFLMNGERIEVKSSLMAWNKKDRCFGLNFHHIKSELHDTLLLAWMTPKSLHVFKHDGMSGVSTNGKATEATGRLIQMYAPSGKKGYAVASAAERFLLKQFRWWGSENEYLARIDFADGDAERIFELGKTRNMFGGADEDESESEDETED